MSDQTKPQRRDFVASISGQEKINEKVHLLETNSIFGFPPPQWLHVREVGAGLVPVEDVRELLEALEKSKARIEFMAKEPYNFESDQTLQAIDLALKEFDNLKGAE